MNRNPSYFEFQVEKQAAPMPGNAPARYPDALRAAAVEGQVDAQFVVDTTGRVVMSTFKVLKSSDVLFTNSVKSALADMKFYPAEVGSRKVRQLMQMPFVFSLSK
jgi:protein TonB